MFVNAGAKLADDQPCYQLGPARNGPLGGAGDSTRPHLYWTGESAGVEGVANEFELELGMRALLSLLVTEHRGLLLHASSVVHQGRAYVFMGPSGAGKSTMAALSLPRTVLSDEGSLVRMVDGEIRCYSTPFWGSWGRDHMTNVDVSAPVAGFYVLGHARDNRVEPLGGQAAILALLASQMFLDQDRGRIPKCLDNAKMVALHALVFRLLFRPDQSVWTTISDGVH